MEAKQVISISEGRDERDVKEEVKQEVKEEVKLESVLSLLNLGLTVEQIAKALDLSIAKVQQISDERSSN